MSEKEIYREITRYIDGDLSGEEVDNLWEQFINNPEYYKWFETELHLRDLAKEENGKNIHSIHSRPNNTSENTRKNNKTWIIAAAAVIILSFGIQLFFAGETDYPHPNSISQIQIDEMSGSDIMRSEGTSSHSVDVEINRALALAYEGNTENAAGKFKSLLLEDPDPQQKARIEMNLGILYYNMADYDQARVYFESAAETDAMSRFFNEKAWWFLGNAYLNLEMLEEARSAVNNVYISEGRFIEPAASLLKKLDEELGHDSDQPE
jgi:tetratricopeptide (TPR) repeat protein